MSAPHRPDGPGGGHGAVEGAEGPVCVLCRGERTAAGFYLGPECVEALRADYAAVPAVLTDLRATYAREARVVGPTRRAATEEQPLPYAQAAADAHARLLAVLGRAEAPAGLSAASGAPLRREAVTVLAVRSWLASRPAEIARTPDADRHVLALRAALTAARRVVDLPPSQWFAGACWAPLGGGTPCPADLYADAGAAVVVCTSCKARHDAGRRKAWLLDQVDDQLAYANQIAAAVSGLGAEVSAERIRKWSERGRIVSRGRDARGRQLYRVGDVLDALRNDIANRKRTA